MPPQRGLMSSAGSTPGIQTFEPWAAEVERANLPTTPPGQPGYVSLLHIPLAATSHVALSNLGNGGSGGWYRWNVS